jgi:hypothetical protein
MTPENQNVPVCGLAVAICSARRDRLAKLAEALGWMRCERLGKEVWYDPTGGHVTWEDLPAALDDDIDQLIAECKDKTMRADDAAALEKLGNPFLPPNR